MKTQIKFFCFCLFLLPGTLSARAKVDGYCQQGNGRVKVAGLFSTVLSPSASPVMSSYPSCTVTVYLPGTTTGATIYSDNNGTPQSFTFSANSLGYYYFYADDGNYDINFSGVTVPTPFTLGNRPVIDPFYTLLNSHTLMPVPNAKSITKDLKMSYDINVADFGALCDVTFNPVTGAVTSATDDWIAITNAIAFGAALGGATIHLPPTGHLCGVSKSIDIGAQCAGVGVYFEGQAVGNTSGIFALSTGTFSSYVDQNTNTPHTYLVSIGGTGGTCAVSYAKVQHMQLNANGVVDTAAFSQSAQEHSTFSDLLITSFKYVGLDLQSYGIQNSHYSDLTFYPANAASYACMELFSVITRVEVSNITCNGGGSGSQTGGIVAKQGGGSMAFRNIHYENGSVGIYLYGLGYITVDNLETGPNTPGGGIYFAASQALLATNITGQPGITDCVARSCAVAQTEAFYFSSANGTLLALGDTAIPIILPFGNGQLLNVSGIDTALLQVATEHTIADISGSASTVHWIDTNNNGIMYQNDGVPHNYNGGGLNIGGNGYASDATVGYAIAGASTDTGTYVARRTCPVTIPPSTGPCMTSASGVVMVQGTVQFFANTGLTAADSTHNGFFSPNIEMEVTPTNVVIPSLRSTSGHWYACVDSTGNLISQAAPCA